MFQKGTSKELTLLDGGNIIGSIRINATFAFKNTMRPFFRNGKREIISIGRVNYALLDEFVRNSLNHYYTNIENTKDQQERNRRIIEYNELYNLWYKVNVARQNNDIALNSYYDDIVYRLYLLGYRD